MYTNLVVPLCIGNVTKLSYLQIRTYSESIVRDLIFNTLTKAGYDQYQCNDQFSHLQESQSHDSDRILALCVTSWCQSFCTVYTSVCGDNHPTGNFPLNGRAACARVRTLNASSLPISCIYSSPSWAEPDLPRQTGGRVQAYLFALQQNSMQSSTCSVLKFMRSFTPTQSGSYPSLSMQSCGEYINNIWRTMPQSLSVTELDGARIKTTLTNLQTYSLGVINSGQLENKLWPVLIVG